MPTSSQRRLSYISRASDSITEIDLREIWGVAEVLHRRMDLSGLLAYTGEHFFQVIEGPSASMEELLVHIRADARHSAIRVLCDEAIQTRRYHRWQATVVDSPALADQARALALSPDSGCKEAADLAQRLLGAQSPDTQL